MNSLAIVVVILLAFTIGYKIISWLFDRLRGTPPSAESTARNFEETGSRWDPSFHTSDSGGSRVSAYGAHTRMYEDPETRYARVLGLPRNFTVPEIKDRYRTLIASYHPDKVNHLGPEFREVAARKTRETIEAFEYFRVKYNMK